MKQRRSMADEEEQAARIDAMRVSERRMLEEAHRLEACDCKEGMFPNLGRRRVLLAAGTGLAAAAAGLLPAGARAQDAPTNGGWTEAPEDPTKVPGRPIGMNDGYGTRSAFETEIRGLPDTPSNLTAWSMTPLDKSLGIVTPSGLHFERYRNGIPAIDPSRHTLTVHGMVDRPRRYTMADLKRFPSVSKLHFIECNGNTSSEWRVPTMKTVQFTHGLLSTSEWTGVPFSFIAKEVGHKPDAAWVLAEGSDAAVMARSVPLDKMLSDGILVYGQNGEAMRPEQGYPLRLLLPGWEGNINIKWLRRLEISDKPFMTREESPGNADPMPDGTTRRFTFVMEAKSVITFPSGEMILPGAGFYEVTGLAWSGRGKVSRVEVSIDGGLTWQAAALQDPVLPMCTTRFRFPWFWDGSPAVLQSRCVDETGYVQPTLRQLTALRGLASHYHNNAIQSWAVASDGSVSNVHA